MSVVRNNLMTREGYTPYCGSNTCMTMPRTTFDGHQFNCPKCGWRSDFERGFILQYKAKWNKE